MESNECNVELMFCEFYYLAMPLITTPPNGGASSTYGYGKSVTTRYGIH